MTVRLDDWSLSTLSGAMDWTVMLPSGARTSSTSNNSGNSGGRSAAPRPTSSIFEQSHFYPALFTELTPTVITGSDSATVPAAPVVYARLSSVVRVEKVGPRQLRLRQQLGTWPASYRLLILTAASPEACDDWWRALHRLTYNNGSHASELEDEVATPPPQPQVRSLLSERDSVDNAAALASNNSDVRGDGGVGGPVNSSEADVAHLKRILLSPTPLPPNGQPVSRPSLHLAAHPTASPPALHMSNMNNSAALSNRDVKAQELPLPSRTGRWDGTAPHPDHDAVATPSASSLSASTIDAVTSREHRRTYRPRHQDKDRETRTTASVASAPQIKVIRSTRSESTQTASPPPPPPPPPHIYKTVAAPALNSLLPDAPPARESIRRDADEGSAFVKDVVPPSRSKNDNSLGGAAIRDADARGAPSQRLPPPPPPPPPQSDDGVRPFISTTSPSRSDALAETAANGSELASSATTAAVSPSAQNPSLPSTLWRSTRALVPATPTAALLPTFSPSALDPALYEPIHIDTAAVPRARSTSPPALFARPLTWRHSAFTASPWSPRLTYGCGFSGFPRDGSVTLSERRRASPPTPSPRSRSAHASTAQPGSGRHRRRSSTPPAASANPRGVSPLLSVIAKPHLFLKHPVQTSSRSRNHSDSTAAYVFVTTDEDCVVTVPAARFKECVEEAHLLKGRDGRSGGSGGGGGSRRGFSSASMASMSIAVRSFERAKHFFGEDHCRAIRAADVDRVTRGNEEPLVLLNAAQRERFRDPSKLICIVSATHAFFLEATNSTEAAWYVRSWKKYLHIRRGPHHNSHHSKGY